MFCSNCGKTLKPEAKFCDRCGHPVRIPPESNEDASLPPQQTIVPTPEPEPEPVFEPEPEPVHEDVPAFEAEPEPVVPEENRPLGPWAYFGYGLLFAIPVIGFILLIIFSFAGKNVNRKNFARSYWCWFILVLAIVLILFIVLLTGVLRGVLDGAAQWLHSVGLDWLARFFG